MIFPILSSQCHDLPHPLHLMPWSSPSSAVNAIIFPILNIQCHDLPHPLHSMPWSSPSSAFNAMIFPYPQHSMPWSSPSSTFNAMIFPILYIQCHDLPHPLHSMPWSSPSSTVNAMIFPILYIQCHDLPHPLHSMPWSSPSSTFNAMIFPILCIQCHHLPHSTRCICGWAGGGVGFLGEDLERGGVVLGPNCNLLLGTSARNPFTQQTIAVRWNVIDICFMNIVEVLKASLYCLFLPFGQNQGSNVLYWNVKGYS